MLAAEKYHLKNIKKILEPHCKIILDQMQVDEKKKESLWDNPFLFIYLET
jgi:hypothetical protein